MSPKTLITGCRGFIGSHLAQELKKKGWQVFALMRPGADAEDFKSRGIESLSADYGDMDSLRQAVTGMDYVFHLGALINGRSWDAFVSANVTATRNLLSACLEAGTHLKRFVHVSSISAAGPSRPGHPGREEDPPHPTSLYGKSKLLGENEARGFLDRLPLVIIRPPNVLGWGQRELMRLIALLDRGIHPLLGDGSPQTSVCFVEDLVAALILVAQDERALGQTYYIGHEQACSWQEMSRFIQQELGRKWTVKIPFTGLYSLAALLEVFGRISRNPALLTRKDVLSARHNCWIFSGEKISRELGFSCRTAFETGMSRIIRQYLESRK